MWQTLAYKKAGKKKIPIVAINCDHLKAGAFSGFKILSIICVALTPLRLKKLALPIKGTMLARPPITRPAPQNAVNIPNCPQ